MSGGGGLNVEYVWSAVCGVGCLVWGVECGNGCRKEGVGCGVMWGVE